MFMGLNPHASKEQFPACAGRGKAVDLIFAHAGGGLHFEAWGFSPVKLSSRVGPISDPLTARLDFRTVADLQQWLDQH